MTDELKMLNEAIDKLTEKVQALIKENDKLKTELDKVQNPVLEVHSFGHGFWS